MNFTARIPRGLVLVCAAGVILFVWGLPAAGEPTESASQSSQTGESGTTTQAEESSQDPIPLNEEETILLDRENRRLIVKTKVVLRQGLLEMLLCKRHTKEHESILSFNGQAKILHAGLLALGLEAGDPVVFLPEFQPPAGPKLKIELVWTDKKGETHRVRARRWIRHSIHRYFAAPLESLPPEVDFPPDDPMVYDATNNELSWYGPMTKKERDHYLALSDEAAYQKAIKSFYKRTRNRPLSADFVFTGSAFTRNQRTGQRVYLAESGYVICVANFPSALIDVARKSTAQGQQNLLYETWTERIPPLGTPVRMIITPAEEDGSGRAEEPEKGRRGE